MAHLENILSVPQTKIVHYCPATMLSLQDGIETRAFFSPSLPLLDNVTCDTF